MVNLKRTREDILSSVLELVHHQGFQSTRLKAVFNASGSSSGSFYNYFQSKDELAHALIDFQWEQMKANLLDSGSEGITEPIERVFSMLDRLEKKHLIEPDCGGCFLGNLIVELAKQDESFQHHLIQVFDEWQAVIAGELRAGKADLLPQVDPDLLAEQIMTAIEGVLLLNRLYNDRNRLRRGFELARQILKSALAGSVTQLPERVSKA